MDSDDQNANDAHRPQPKNPVPVVQPSVSPEVAALPPATGSPTTGSPTTGSPTTGSPTTGSSGRCLLYGCSVVFIGGLFLILCAGFGTYVYFTRQVKTFTSETPAVLPMQEYGEEKLVELESRVQEFEQTLAAVDEPVHVVADDVVAPDVPVPKAPAKQLILSAADLNALIARHPQFKNKLFVKIDDGVITGDLSLPIDDYLPGGKGRFFNGSGTFDVKLQDGDLIVRLVDAAVGGQPMPPVVMSEIRKQNLAKEFQQDARASRSLQKFESIEVMEDRVILTLKNEIHSKVP